MYKERKKIIPKTIHEYLVSDLALAVVFFFMDDGGRGGNTPTLIIPSMRYKLSITP